MENKESYKPSAEELQNAENLMGPKKAMLSKIRELSSNALKEKGIDGYLEYSGVGNETVVSGRLNGHDVIIRVANNDREKEGTVDGIPLTDSEIRKFEDTYREIWAHYQRVYLEAAQEEDLVPNRAQILKDIGL